MYSMCLLVLQKNVLCLLLSRRLKDKICVCVINWNSSCGRYSCKCSYKRGARRKICLSFVHMRELLLSQMKPHMLIVVASSIVYKAKVATRVSNCPFKF